MNSYPQLLQRRLFFIAFWVIGCVAFDHSPVFATFDPIPGTRYESNRNAAMGDASISVGDDAATGLFINPAVLGRLRKGEMELFNLTLFGDMGFYNNLPTSFGTINLGSFASTLTSQPGTLFGMGGGFLPTYTFKFISVGLLVQNEYVASGNADGTINYRVLYQLVPTMGMGFRLFNGVLRFGYSLQFVQKAEGNFTNVAAPTSYTVGLDQGAGLSHTFGVSFVIPMLVIPSFDVVLRNAFDTTYSASTFLHVSSSSVGPPATEPMSIDAAFSIHPKMGQGAILTLTASQRDLSNSSGHSMMSHLAFGAELNVRDRIFVRGGWRGGYLSGGFALRSSRGAEISFSYYTVETGATYMSQGDTRVQFQYKIRSF